MNGVRFSEIGEGMLESQFDRAMAEAAIDLADASKAIKEPRKITIEIQLSRAENSSVVMCVSSVKTKMGKYVAHVAAFSLREDDKGQYSLFDENFQEDEEKPAPLSLTRKK